MTTKPTFPILIKEDTQGYERFIRAFNAAVLPTVRDVREMYENLKLQEPFSDQVWQDIIHGGRKVKAAIEARLEAVREFLGVSAGMVKAEVMTSEDTYEPIRQRMERLNQATATGSDQIYRLPLERVINVATQPEISPEGKAEALELFRIYLQDEQEAQIKEDVESFVAAFNKMTKTLEGTGLWKHHFGPVFQLRSTFNSIIWEESRKTGKGPVLSMNPGLILGLRAMKKWSKL